MLTISPAVRIYLATGATDLRRSIDGLSAIVRDQFALDPCSGHLFAFRNRRGDRLKLLVWDHGGFWVFYKRLEQGTFAWPADGDQPNDPLPNVASRAWTTVPSTQLDLGVLQMSHVYREQLRPNQTQPL